MQQCTSLPGVARNQAVQVYASPQQPFCHFPPRHGPTPRRHTSRFLVIWLTLLPFTLWQSCGWALVPMSLIIAFLLLGEACVPLPPSLVMLFAQFHAAG